MRKGIFLSSRRDHDLNALQERFGKPVAIAEALVKRGQEAEFIRQGLWLLLRVFINTRDKLLSAASKRAGFLPQQPGGLPHD